ncbi:MAG: hypothetical protein HOU81_00140 [Hamadaea sp.]|uniref:hypothetical protein n=1 Tax=Hamadaea sp. TaxID=2024425 RepID=UPI0017C4CDA0|nr:hypothetical protein [Hamadaea sp.]NUR69226.1 hypothetical protein [Hamadaea sp.]NUT22298.1 hypothetical protein [Hamadaea sp.]
MDQREHKLAWARLQATWVAVASLVLAIVGWVLVAASLNDAFAKYPSSGIGVMVAGSLALAVFATVMTGAGLVVAWVSAALGPYKQR